VPATPSEFFAEAHRRFAEAFVRAPDGDVDFVLAGRRIRLCFAGTAMRPIIEPVFRHLPRAAAGAAELTIMLWDTLTTGVGLPPRPWRSDDHGARGFVLPFCDTRLTTRFDAWSGALSMIDDERDLAFQWVPDAGSLPHWEHAHPLSTVLARWLRRFDLPMVHAAAIGRPAGGALIVGRGGSGKSTTVLAGIDAGLRTAGDDYVLIDCAAVVAHSLYGSATLRTEHRRRFPRLMPEVDDKAAVNGKCVTMLAVRRPETLVAALPLVAVVVPRVIGHGPCGARPISPALALRALAPSTLLQLGHGDSAGLKRLAALCRRLPCYALDLGGDVDGIPAALGEILDSCAGRRAASAGAR
jgi:hypothetical protein